VYFRLKLGDFIYPTNLEEFQKGFRSSFAEEQIPHPMSAGPDSNAGGYFALMGKSVDAAYARGEEAWIYAVENMAKTRSFVGKKAVFARGSVRTASGKQQLPKYSSNVVYYPLVRGKRYTLQLYYRFPMQDAQREADTTLSVATHSVVRPC